MTKTATTKHTMPVTTNEPAEYSMASVAESLKVTYAPNSDMPTMSVCSLDRINDRELQSVYALLAYVAYNQNVQQETVQMVVEAQFKVDHVAKIRRDDYMRTVEFLIDLKMDEVLN